MPVIRIVMASSVAALVLSSCSLLSPEPVASEEPALDFCGAMKTAVAADSTAVAALDELVATMDTLAASASSESDLELLNSVGAETVSTATEYADALKVAAGLAPTEATADLDTLQDFWTVYAAGLGDVAASTTSYGNFVDQSSALLSSEAVVTLIDAQPAALEGVNDVYLSTCS